MTLYDKDGNKIKVDENKELARGGEGRIIQVAKDKVVKLYHHGIESITESKYKSLYQLKSNVFMKPEKLLYDNRKKIVGFSMNILPPDYYPLYSALNINFCNRHGIDDKYKVRMSTKLIDAMSYAHKQNIVIGDFNPFNMSIDDKCNLIFIDVDSYETPGDKHSGRLLTEVRDYLYNGEVNKNSDYFSLATVVFNFLTNVHPFKGVHKKYGSIEERMVKKLPVLKSDPDLKVPKCYHPIKDKFLADQFERIFLGGERFLISLKPGTKIQVKQKIKVKQKDDQLMIFEMLNDNVRFIEASDNRVCAHMKDQIIVFDTSYKGQFREIGRLDKSYKTYPVKDKVFWSDGVKLYYTTDFKEKHEISNFEFDNPLFVNQYDDIIVVINNDVMYKIYLNNIISTHNHITGDNSNNVKVETLSVFGRGFTKYNGMVQYINGRSFVYYNNNSVLNTVHFPDMHIKDMIQKKNVGIAQVIENDKIKYNLFNIKGLKVEFDGEDFKGLRRFGYKENQFLIIPEDDALSFRRIIDFGEIANFKCNLVDENSEVYVTDAGIVVNNGTGLYLMNSH